jgi:hypothetical protein
MIILADYSLNDTDLTGLDLLSTLPNKMHKCLVSADPTNKIRANQNGWPFLQKPIRKESLAAVLEQVSAPHIKASVTKESFE